jgi:xanthine dehydrogenase molybdenum-binding subunit
LEHDTLVDESSGMAVPLETLATRCRETGASPFEDGTFSAVGRYKFDERDHLYWVPISQAVVVACNTLTGEIEVPRLVTAADVGTAINPPAVEQQLEGGAAQGIGGAIYEEIRYDDGHVVNGSLKEYPVPRATDLPNDVDNIVFESDDTEGPYGAKSVGEIGLFPTAPAIATAVEDALEVKPTSGNEFTTVPMTPERVMDRLMED